MSAAIRVVRLAVANVGPIRTRVDLGELAPGLNLVTGENETGKSTIVEALRCALFESHRAGHKNIKALQPHGTREAPEVWVTLEVDGARVEVHKRFVEKAIAEVRVDDALYVGDEAEEQLRARLEARPPGRQGAKRGDMGVWGLLWVTQDEVQHGDPGDGLDPDARGTLHEAIGRQVAQVTGGRHAERLREAVRAHLARFFTEKTEKPTGEYRQAVERHAVARERVAAIEKALAEVEHLSERHEAATETLAELRREIPAFERDVEEARRREDDVTRRREALHLAEAEADGARARAERLEGERAERTRLVAALAAAERDAARAAEALEELTRTAADRAEAEAEARRALSVAEARAQAARAQVATAEARAQAARRAEKARRIGERWVAARAVIDERTTLEARRAREALTDEDRAALQALDRDVSRLQARLEAEGTRVGAWSFGAPAKVDVPGVGAVEVLPAAPGLARAHADAQANRRLLSEALAALGAGDVEAARRRRMARLEREVEAAAVERALRTQAAEGVERLAEAVATGRAALERAEAALARALDAAARAETWSARLEGEVLDTAALAALEARAHDLAIARARSEAIGTGVEVRALAGTSIRVDDGPAEALAPDAERRFKFTRPARLRIGDVAEIGVDPGGEELRRAGAELAAAEASLRDALAVVGAADLDAARQRARERADNARGLDEARRVLADAAPEGLQKLKERVPELRAAQREREERLARARAALARRGELEAALAGDAFTAQALEQLERLEAEQRRLDDEVAARAARLSVAGLTHVVAVAGAITLPGGVVVAVEPGEGGAAVAAALAAARDDLEARLARLGLPDVAAADARWHERLQLDERLRGLDERLAALAPEGADALRAAAAMAEAVAPTGAGAAEAGAPTDAEAAEAGAPTGAGAAGAGAPSADVDALDAVVERVRADAEAAEAARREAERSAAAAGERRARLDGEREGARVDHDRRAGERADARLRLDEARRARPDDALDAELAAARADAAAAAERAADRRAALDAAAPDLLADDLERARAVLATAREREQALIAEVANLDALLTRASTEGRFEELGEARADLAAAEDELARYARDARAARLLADAVERAYGEAQRRFLAPVLREAHPYLARLRPGTDLRMSADLRLEKVLRHGTEEDFERLSGGTREQLSVIVRLALARVLAADGRTLPLILDDTMGWTDDRRFAAMVDILRNAARTQQVIILTCHPSRFIRVKADRTIALDELKRLATLPN